jgi:threonine/homoserine/homoserine lactone efflux protein
LTPRPAHAYEDTVSWQTWSITVELVVLNVYGVLAGRAAHLAARPRAVALLERVVGGLLIGAGLRMAMLRRTG